MSMGAVFRKSLGAQIALKLAIVMLVLTALGATVITTYQTRQMEELTLEKARVAAAIGAQQYGETLEGLIDAGTLTVNDVFDKNYFPIKGYDWGATPKHHTRYDSVTDRAVLMLQDKFLEHEDFVFAVGLDENGYLPTHNAKFSQPLTGVADTDRAGNRTKRTFADAVSLNATRSLEPTLVQVYKRDTGETLWDVSAPIFVKGKHWGGFRLAVSRDRIAMRQRGLVGALLGVFGVFLLVTISTMYLVVRGAMKPVVALAETANQISLGEALDTPIKSKAVDEIGQLTKTIDRLRASMKAAMTRLGH
jgi:HAMP domain-containing protein